MPSIGLRLIKYSTINRQRCRAALCRRLCFSTTPPSGQQKLEIDFFFHSLHNMDTLVPVIHVHGDIAHFFLDLQVSQALWRVTVSFDPSCTQVDQLCVNTSVFPACHRGLSFRKCWCAVISLRPSLHDQQVPYWASINWLLRRLLPPLSSLFYNSFFFFFLTIQIE